MASPPVIRAVTRASRAPGAAALGIQRRGLVRRAWTDVYHALLVMSWPRFFGAMVLAYVALNLLFGTLFWLGGDCIAGARPGSYWDALMFSVQTIATIGYGVLSPKTKYADVLVAIEAFVGLFGVAFATGLMFAKFARPTARILFSNVACVTVRDGVPSLLFRMANERGNQVVEAQVRCIVARTERTPEGETMRRFHDLTLTRTFSPIFALSWTVTHPVDESSPLFGETVESMRAKSTEVVVLVSGLDETFQQTIHARWSYVADEIRWNEKFRDIISTVDGTRVIDYARFHDTEPADAKHLLPVR
jgi:inward rectifier potassium channel